MNIQDHCEFFGNKEQKVCPCYDLPCCKGGFTEKETNIRRTEISPPVKGCVRQMPLTAGGTCVHIGPRGRWKCCALQRRLSTSLKKFGKEMTGMIWLDKHGKNYHYLKITIIIIFVGSWALGWEKIWMLLVLVLDNIAYMAYWMDLTSLLVQ